MNDNRPTRIGFFGKMPSYGDFVRRGFPTELAKPWDDWLQAGLVASHQALGEDWLERYLSGPIWRFCLSAGVCGDSRWMGAMIPSVDRVGRYFPLTAITELAVNRSLFGAAATSESWFSRLEEAMLATLQEEGLTTEEFETRLAALEGTAGRGPTADESPPNGPTDPPEGGGSDQTNGLPDRTIMAQQHSDPGGFVAIRLPDPADLEHAPGQLADTLARQTCGEFSLWWSSGSAFVPATARIYAGLPPVELFWTLLDEQAGT